MPPANVAGLPPTDVTEQILTVGPMFLDSHQGADTILIAIIVLLVLAIIRQEVGRRRAHAG